MAPESEGVCVCDVRGGWAEVGTERAGGGAGRVCHLEAMSTIALGSLKTHFTRLTQT